MIKKIAIISILAVLSLSGNAQNTNSKTAAKKTITVKPATNKPTSGSDAKALQVVNKASENYNNAGGVNAKFTLQMLEQGGRQGGSIDGSIKLKGSKFKIEVDEMITWFDGKNQWVYLFSNKEVNLSNPTEDELLMINPVNVFQLYKHGYKCKYMGENKEGGKMVEKVRLTPVAKYSSVLSIDASFEKTTYKPLNILITNKDKSGSKITISTYQTGQKYADAYFTFPQKEYPNLDVIDLR